MLALQILTGLVAVAAAVAIEQSASSKAYVGPQGNGPFSLQVIATGGNLKYSGMFLDAYHTGAGFNQLVAFDKQEGTLECHFNKTNGAVFSKRGDYNYYLSTDAQVDYETPKGYHYMGFNVFDNQNHWHFTTPDDYLQFGPHFAEDCFAVCPAVIYTPGVYLPTLVYREPGAKKNATCADVKVKAIF